MKSYIRKLTGEIILLTNISHADDNKKLLLMSIQNTHYTHTVKPLSFHIIHFQYGLHHLYFLQLHRYKTFQGMVPDYNFLVIKARVG
jgi:hypothetical protein